jgi:hypothetical protein
MEPETKSKFTFLAEILPQNERTNQIMAKRDAEEAEKRVQLEEVGTVLIQYDIMYRYD